VVLRTKTGQFIVTPDNGTLTLIAESLGIAEVRAIDELVNRRKGSGESYTFHGRDVYAYTGARLAAGVIRYDQVGPLLPPKVVAIPYQKAALSGVTIKGTIAILDIQYGNIWTNIPGELFQQLHPVFGDVLEVALYHKGERLYQGEMPYAATFGVVPVGRPLAYLNSLLQLSFALNQGSFADVYKIGSGNDWSVEVKKK
jgi:S-adenosylmethionine hydrolase